MDIQAIVKKAKWSLGKETPKRIYIGENFNLKIRGISKKMIAKIDGIPIFIDKKLKRQQVRVVGQKREVNVDLVTLKKRKLYKVA